MRIAVISDTHGQFDHVPAIVPELGQVDWLVHAGDHLSDLPTVARLLGVPRERCHGVLGNCDYPPLGPKEEVLEFQSARLLLTHGHLYNVKDNLHRLYYRAQELGVQAVIFGHTHVALNDEVGGIRFFNPGSLTAPRLHDHFPSCGLLKVADGNLQFSHLFSR